MDMNLNDFLNPDKKYEKELPKLNSENASAILANVFNATEQAPSSIPLDVLTSYTKYRRDRYALQKNLIMCILVAFILLPLCFISPKFTVTEVSRAHTGVPTYEISVSNWIPVRLVTAKLNNNQLAVYESDTSVYTVEPKSNGDMKITVTLFNRQFDVASVTVSGVDAESPILLKSEYVGKNLRIYTTDGPDGVGVDFENAYGISVKDSGYIPPCGYNLEAGYVEFAYQESMNIFIPDLNGNILHLILSSN